MKAWKALFTALVSSWVFCLDQAAKIYAHTQLKEQEPLVIIEGFFNFHYVTNKGRGCTSSV